MGKHSEYLKIAEEAVATAETLFRDGLGSDPWAHKLGGDFATEVDLEIEETVRRMLTERTGIGVYGEEAGGAYNPEAVWIVDPIDGTSNYAAGNPMCAILVSLVIDGELVVAVTSMPLLERRLTAEKDESVHINGHAMTPIANRDVLVAQIGFSSIASSNSSDFPSPKRLDLIGALARTYLRPRITGSVGVDLAFTAQGIFDGAISFSPYMWDNAAGVLLVRAAGGVVTDIYGDRWHPKSTGVVAGTPAAHQEIMSNMNEIRDN